jgi:hypothetical protein
LQIKKEQYEQSLRAPPPLKLTHFYLHFSPIIVVIVFFVVVIVGISSGGGGGGKFENVSD